MCIRDSGFWVWCFLLEWSLPNLSLTLTPPHCHVPHCHFPHCLSPHSHFPANVHEAYQPERNRNRTETVLRNPWRKPCRSRTLRNTTQRSLTNSGIPHARIGSNHNHLACSITPAHSLRALQANSLVGSRVEVFLTEFRPFLHSSHALGATECSPSNISDACL